MSDLAIRVDNLSKQYLIGLRRAGQRTFREALVESLGSPVRWMRGEKKSYETFWALKDVSFEVKQGEAVGIIGSNGAGKSTLLKILSRITKPTTGRVDLYGRVACLLEVGTGFHSELSGRDNVYLNGAILGMSRRDIDRKFDEIVEFSGVEKFLDTPVKHYSSGMYVRLAFSVAVHLDSDILIVDEVLAVGDAEFQKKCLGKMSDAAEDGRSIIFVSHNINAIQRLTTRSIFLKNGVKYLEDDTYKVAEAYYGNMAPPKAKQPSPDAKLEDISLNSVTFCSDSLKPGFNNPLKFDFDITTRVNVQDVSIGLGIVNSIGARVLTSYASSLNFMAGKPTFSFVLSDHHLPPGNYSITLGIDIGSTSILYQEFVLSFAIPEEGIDIPFILQRKDRIGAFIAPEIIFHSGKLE